MNYLCPYGLNEIVKWLMNDEIHKHKQHCTKNKSSFTACLMLSMSVESDSLLCFLPTYFS